MLNVTLLAATLRGHNFDYVDRLILVGDPGQLPPIGPESHSWNLIEVPQEGQAARNRVTWQN